MGGRLVSEMRNDPVVREIREEIAAVDRAIVGLFNGLALAFSVTHT